MFDHATKITLCNAEKKCLCSNGEGATGTACPKDNDAKCVSCTGKFFLDGTKCKAWTNCFNQGRVRKKAGTGTTDAECGWQPGTFLALSLCVYPFYLSILGLAVSLCGCGLLVHGRDRVLSVSMFENCLSVSEDCSSYATEQIYVAKYRL